jgi:psp operon transcriptional activator
VGSSTSIEADVRIIAATNADLMALAANDRFKQDLLDRLSFEVLFLPPLRDRKEDILLLARHFAGKMALELGREDVPQFSEEAVEALESYSWPGNIRELKNVVERAVYRSESPVIGEIAFDPFHSPFALNRVVEKKTIALAAQGRTEDLLSRPFHEAMEEMKIRLLKRALERAKYNQKGAAKLLGVTYHQFRGLYRKHREKIT